MNSKTLLIRLCDFRLRQVKGFLYKSPGRFEGKVSCVGGDVQLQAGWLSQEIPPADLVHLFSRIYN